MSEAWSQALDLKNFIKKNMKRKMKKDEKKIVQVQEQRGEMNEWTNFFRSQMGLGYNAFHLVPIQQTGESNSYYSLKSHLELSDHLFKGSQEEKNSQLKNFL